MNKDLEIRRLDIHKLDVPLMAPFTIASSRLDHVHNVAVQVTLADGTSGWGETSTLPPVTAEDQASALEALRHEADRLRGRSAGEWRRIALELHERIPNLPSVRAGLEMAVIDALARHCGIPLFRFFGGFQNRLATDITIPICPAVDAEALARHYRREGFEILKVKVGLDRSDDIDRLKAITRGHPACRLILDANAGYSADEVFALLRELRLAGIEPALLEQPVAREDWDGLGKLAREAGVPVAADESCRTPEDALRIARDCLAQVINIKLVKCGVVQALEIAAIARAGGLKLMVGGMVETRLAMGFSAHFAAGLGGFEWIDLDTPMLLAEDPVEGGCKPAGPHYRLDMETAGHGGRLPGKDSN
jgi:L-alanine-DL-glutamate epimerase-like enolase superfamily enzyme